MLYEIHTKDKVFTEVATYFVADRSGVMFFNDADMGIAFVPSVNLLFVRANRKAKAANEAEQKAISMASMGQSYDATKGLFKNAGG